MIISHRHKFIFVKTFKTAGSSVEKILFNYLDKNDIITGSDNDELPSLNAKPVRHRPASWIKEKYPYEWKHYFKFSIDRNPWDVAVSWFFWMKHAGRLQEETFDSWIKSAKLSGLKNWDKYTIDNTIVVDRVLKYENLDNELYTIPIPYNGELKNVFVKRGHRPTTDYKTFYNKKTKLLIQDNFSEVIKLFGYTYDD